MTYTPPLPLLLAAVAVLAGCAAPADPVAAPSPSPPPSASASPAAPDCATVPPQSAFTVGSTHPCFGPMSQRFGLWLGGNTLPDGSGTPASDTFTADSKVNVGHVQRIMGDSPDGWFGQGQWTRLLAQGPPPITELRTSGIGPLWFGMTGEQLNASGYGRTRTDADLPPDAQIIGADAVGCYNGEVFYAAYVKGPSDVVTVEGISSGSTVADLRRTFGDRLLSVVNPDFPDFEVYAVMDGDFGYAFVPQDDGTMMIIAGESAEIERDTAGPHGICGL